MLKHPFFVRLKFQKRSELEFVSRTNPDSTAYRERWDSNSKNEAIWHL